MQLLALQIFVNLQNIIKTANMNDFPLLLASKDLFLSLSTQKIKTLKQAQQLLKEKDHPRAKDIKELLDNFAKIQKQVQRKLNDSDSLVNFSEEIQYDQQNPLAYYWKNPSIIQVIGNKGSGKTALILRLIIDYIQQQNSENIFLLNCSGGITISRFQSIQKYKIVYFDIFTVEELQQVLRIIRNECKRGFVFIDGMYNLLIGASFKNRLGQIFNQLRISQFTVVFTNLVQGKLQIDQKEVLNAMAYYPNFFGGIANCRLSITPDEKQQNQYKIRVLKNLNNKNYQFVAMMDAHGLSELKLLKL